MLKQTDLTRADLNLLVLFEIVLKERHVGRAAERLNLSPSAVSHSLARLRHLLNDPLFLRTPKGVVPSARATELAEPVADILGRVRSVISTAEPFDPATSRRRFTVGAPDAVSAVVLPPLLANLRRAAPGIDISLRQLLPPPGGVTSERAWQPALADLEARSLDIAIVPLRDVPVRFVAQTLYEEEFVVAMRAGHSFARAPTLEQFCTVQHVLVSLAGDPQGFTDEVLAKRGRSRRISLTVPNFMMALAIVADTDLIAVLPRRLVATHAARFGVVSAKAPLPPRRDAIRAIASKAAMRDSGVTWLFGALKETQDITTKPHGKLARMRRIQDRSG
jgi:DNA-binding transcriptional LysR family regulator